MPVSRLGSFDPVIGPVGTPALQRLPHEVFRYCGLILLSAELRLGVLGQSILIAQEGDVASAPSWID